jgi:hypothetical protein
VSLLLLFFIPKTSLLLPFFFLAMSSQLGNPQCCFCPKILTKRRRVSKDYDGPIRAPSGHYQVQMSCSKCLKFMDDWMTVRCSIQLYRFQIRGPSKGVGKTQFCWHSRMTQASPYCFVKIGPKEWRSQPTPSTRS